MGSESAGHVTVPPVPRTPHSARTYNIAYCRLSTALAVESTGSHCALLQTLGEGAASDSIPSQREARVPRVKLLEPLLLLLPLIPLPPLLPRCSSRCAT